MARQRAPRGAHVREPVLPRVREHKSRVLLDSPRGGVRRQGAPFAVGRGHINTDARAL